MRYLISDTHFGHGNVIDYCDRPFADAVSMDIEMYSRWNDIVDDDDTVIHLGDVVHHPCTLEAWKMLDLLDGRKMLVRGNHDGGVAMNDPVNVVESATIRHGKYTFYLEHQPVNQPDIWQIHGHMHNNEPISYPFIHYERKNVNVSVELIDYEPLAMDELIHHLSKRRRFRDINEARNASDTYPVSV